MYKMHRFFTGKVKKLDRPVFYRYSAGQIAKAGPARSKNWNRPVRKNWTGSSSDAGHHRILFVYSKSEYTLESVSVSVRPSVRPSVYTITFERRVRSRWNFLHSSGSLMSRSSSKMSLIGWALPELLQKYWFFPMVFLCFCVLKKWVHSRIGQYVRPFTR